MHRIETRVRRLSGALLLGGWVLLSACSATSPVNADNYAKLSNGMTRDQVYEVLGKPDEVSGGAIGPLNFSAEVWKGSKQTIHVTFNGDKLAMKSIGNNPE